MKKIIKIKNVDSDKTYKIFSLIDKAALMINNGRRRMISIMYLLKQLFQMCKIPYDYIKLSKSKRTLSYHKLWNNVYGLIKNDLDKVINK